MTLLTTPRIQLIRRGHFTAPGPISCADISIVIPVKNNQKGITLFLSEFLKTHPPSLYPQEIIIVDNASQPPITIPKAIAGGGLKITVLTCAAPGPACARNFGVQHVRTEWILFTDSDCIPSSTFLSGYIAAMNGSIGYAGQLKSWGKDWLSRYYETQRILRPPSVDEDGVARPEYIITANALVWRTALEIVGGFNETIKIAAGEDIDLGLRLREIGSLSYVPTTYVYHNFAGGLPAFIRRFIRYGKGNRIISQLYKQDLSPKIFQPEQPSIFNWVLSRIQYTCLLRGYRANDKNRSQAAKDINNTL